MEVWLLPGPLICVIGVIALGKSSRKTKGLKEASCRDPPPLTQRKISWESLFASIIIYHIPFLLSIYLSIYLCEPVWFIYVYTVFSSNNYIVSMYHIYSMSIESIGISGLSETSWTITKHPAWFTKNYHVKMTTSMTTWMTNIHFSISPLKEIWQEIWRLVLGRLSALLLGSSFLSNRLPQPRSKGKKTSWGKK